MEDILKQSTDVFRSITDKLDKKCKSLISLRGSKRMSATKTLTTLDETFPCSEADLDFYINKLSELKTTLTELDNDIHMHVLELEVLSDQQFYIISEACESYIDGLNKHLTALKLAIEKLSSNRGNAASNNFSQANVKLKLPTAKLPEFDGTPEAYDKFIESLDEILNKFNLTQFEKYNYLLQQVHGTARDIVQSVPRSTDSYDTAKKLLSDAFCNKYLQQTSVIRKLIELKLTRNNRFTWISEVRTLVEQMHRLNIDNECFAHFFLWSNMDERFKKEYMIVTGDSQPELNLLLDNAFTVFNRVEELSINHKVSNASVVLATNVNASNSAKAVPQNKLVCQLCSSINDVSETDHSIKNCRRFDTNAKKVAKLKELRGCLRCGSLNHNRFCKVKFVKNCVHCNKAHESYLCYTKVERLSQSNPKNVQKPKNENKPASRSNEAQDATLVGNTHALQYSVMNVNAERFKSNVVLPTFTASFPRSKETARALYDTASQLSFVTERLAKRLKFSVLKNNFKIQINGFNESKTLDTRLVNVQLRINNTVRNFEAVVVPNIRSSVDSSELAELVASFRSCNIELADKYLTRDDGEIDILLGANGLQVLPVQSCIFGEREKSLFFYSCEGVMLSGNVTHLLQNATNLNVLKDFISKLHATF